MKDDIQESAGPLQTATGLKAGAEAAIHSIHTRLIFEDSSTEAVILVDANKVFNSINRKVALHNTVKPLSSGHHQDCEKVSAIERCPLHRGLS